MAASLLPIKAFGATPKQARIIVSLADNTNQGIGALYGAKTHFNRMKDWSVTASANETSGILDTFALQHKAHPASKITFEAWDGAKQKFAVKAYLADLRDADSLNDLVCFVGHNALMDLSIANVPALGGTKTANKDRGRKGAVIACRSAPYFEPHHESLGVESYVMTKGLMAPEAYVLEGFLAAWLNGDTANKARAGAAAQYSKYQEIPIRNANWLFGVKT